MTSQPQCKMCGKDISQHEAAEFNNLCEECFWSYIEKNQKSPRRLPIAYLSGMEDKITPRPIDRSLRLWIKRDWEDYARAFLYFAIYGILTSILVWQMTNWKWGIIAGIGVGLFVAIFDFIFRLPRCCLDIIFRS